MHHVYRNLFGARNFFDRKCSVYDFFLNLHAKTHKSANAAYYTLIMHFFVKTR
jgi:hypothetical protein